ncbi:MAG: DeoR/GlpR transcriptional regulator, partial [Akkermansiaceae bacterium]|nr:DeoR/GlpR transcriptional regulator [Armatimonadota bacterium]
GLTAVDFDAVQVKRAMLEHAGEVIVVADSGKVGQTSFAQIAPINVCSLLITDSGLSDEDAAALTDAGIGAIERC